MRRTRRQPRNHVSGHAHTQRAEVLAVAQCRVPLRRTRVQATQPAVCAKGVDAASDEAIEAPKCRVSEAYRADVKPPIRHLVLRSAAVGCALFLELRDQLAHLGAPIGSATQRPPQRVERLLFARRVLQCDAEPVPRLRIGGIERRRRRGVRRRRIEVAVGECGIGAVTQDLGPLRRRRALVGARAIVGCKGEGVHMDGLVVPAAAEGVVAQLADALARLGPRLAKVAGAALLLLRAAHIVRTDARARRLVDDGLALGEVVAHERRSPTAREEADGLAVERKRARVRALPLVAQGEIVERNGEVHRLAQVRVEGKGRV
mmetsp:Transcript_39274/g.131164  ORF Transcript_39274/g.131164 Transcript_39274/m.131164 type:complete len:318 (-) Transcript_39274:653-1606(-)